MPKRKIETNFLEKQVTLKPFEFKSGPTTEHYTDNQGILWATIEEFPTYEISKTKIVRRKIDKKVNHVYDNDYIRFNLTQF